ncbi:hypothetical protein [Streptomyces sp. NPDC088762]|uniref:hypothetical protein n=1 Tax=Streptomyces sp. NPDC088762 TaxID=3365891 RepID=UPI0037F19F3B
MLGLRVGVGVGVRPVGRADPSRHRIPQRIPLAGIRTGRVAVTHTGARIGIGIGTCNAIGFVSGVTVGIDTGRIPATGPSPATRSAITTGTNAGVLSASATGTDTGILSGSATGILSGSATGSAIGLRLPRPEHRQPRVALLGGLRSPRRSFIYRLVGGLARHQFLLHRRHVRLSECLTVSRLGGIAHVLDENDIAAGSPTKRPRALDR